MLKLFGSLLIVSAFSICGFLKSENLKKRSENLLRIVSSLALLESEISYGQKGMRDALMSIGTIEKLPLFTAVSKNIGTSSMENVFADAISKYDMKLSEADNLTLLEFSQSLGSLDSTAQIKSILHAKELLKNAQKDAYEEYKKYGRLYRNMGLLLGILFALILF